MKILFLKSILCLSMVLAVANISFAQCTIDPNTGQPVSVDGKSCVNTIITAVPFLRIVPDARSGAMGDVGIAISADPNAMHFNASKLAFADKDLGISATYTPWLRALGLQDVYLAYLSGYKRIDELQTVGLGVRFFSLGQINFTDENGQPLGSDRPNEFEISGAYSRKLGEYFSAGLSLKFIYSKLANGQTVGGQVITPGTAVASDVSFSFQKPIKLGGKKTDLGIGLAVSNIGTKISYTNSVHKDFIPTNLGLGTALKMHIDDYNSIALAIDVNKLLVPTPDFPLVDDDQNGVYDYKEISPIAGVFKSFGDAPGGFKEEMSEFMYSFGLEYSYDNQFFVRAGHYNEHSTKGNRKFFTVGLGLKYSVFGLNFAYLVPTSSQRNPLDNTLRFSLLFDFGAFDNEESTSPKKKVKEDI